MSYRGGAVRYVELLRGVRELLGLGRPAPEEGHPLQELPAASEARLPRLHGGRLLRRLLLLVGASKPAEHGARCGGKTTLKYTTKYVITTLVNTR